MLMLHLSFDEGAFYFDRVSLQLTGTRSLVNLAVNSRNSFAFAQSFINLRLTIALVDFF